MSVPAVLLPGPIWRGVDVSRRYFPDAAQRMDHMLPALLRPLLDSADDLARWRLSLLTDGGYPFEFTLTTLNDGIRCTLEIAPPKAPPHLRLREAQALLGAMGLFIQDDGRLTWLETIQRGGALRYGAWLGVRHETAGSAFKIYAEVPQDAQAQAAASAFLNAHLRRPVGVVNRAIQLQMIGWYPLTGELEFYYRIRELRPWEIGALMHPIELEGYHKLVFEHLQLAFGRPIVNRMPGPIMGFSYTLDPDDPGARRTFSLYSFAETLFADDATARRKLLVYFDKIGSDMSYYADMTAPLADYRGRWTYHGMFGITIGHEFPPIAHVGLRPPAEELVHG